MHAGFTTIGGSAKGGLIIAVLALCASLAAGDMLILNGGREITGRLIRRDDREVEFEVHSSSGKVIGVQTYPRSKIARIIVDDEPVTAPPSDPNNPTYMIVPLEGTIGIDVTAVLLEKMLKLARNTRTDIVVLEIDSPGGIVQDLLSMLKVLQQYRDLRIVAYVRRAHSSAAILAMACREIVMAPAASIGGAVVFQFAPDGTPRNIEAKFESIIRNECRAAAEAAGHNSLLVDGMMDAGIVLQIAKQGRRRVVVKVDKRSPEGELLKAKGKILTLTAKRAVHVGLASGIAASRNNVPIVLGLKQWQKSIADPGRVLKQWRTKIRATVGSLRAATKRGNEYISKAAAQHPRRFRYDTRAAVRAQADKCLALLRLADNNYAMAERTVDANPDLGFSKEGLTQIRSRIKVWISEIEAIKRRYKD